MTADLAPYGRAVYLLDEMLVDGIDADDLVREALTAVGRMFDGLGDDEVAATLDAVAEMAKVWPLAPEQRAAAESITAQDELSTRPEVDVTRAHVAVGDVPDALRIDALNALATWVGDGADLCTHAPAPAHNRPVFAASWRVGLIVCPRCTHLLGRPPRSCRVCGDSGADATWIIYGRLAYLTAMCASCYPIPQGD